MELTQDEGQIVRIFDPQTIARVLEQEILRTKLRGGDKIRLTLDIEDAKMLSNALKVR